MHLSDSNILLGQTMSSVRIFIYLVLLAIPNLTMAKTYVGISGPLASSMKYSDTYENVNLSPSTVSDSTKNIGIEVMSGDRERGSKWRKGFDYRKISIQGDGKDKTTSYFFESAEYLGKLMYTYSPVMEREGSFGFNPTAFVGFGVAEYHFKQLDEEGRISEKTKEPGYFNYTPYGIELPLALYFKNFYIGLTYRHYLNTIKIKYLPNADGSASTGTFKGYSGFFFNFNLIFR